MQRERQSGRGGFVVVTMLILSVVLLMLLALALSAAYCLHDDSRRAKARLQRDASTLRLASPATSAADPGRP